MSVFKGIEEVEPSALELKTLKNGMLETIVEGRNSNAGFYRLLNVRMSLFTYCNIEILMDVKVSQKPGIEKMQQWHERCKKNPEEFLEPNENNCINATEFEECLSGICRILYFRKNSNDANYRLMDLIEGQFNQGFIDGYARHIEIRKTGCDIYTHCKVGFWCKQEVNAKQIEPGVECEQYKNDGG